MTEAAGRGRAKAILLGEHAVVHGSPALAMALDLTVEIELLNATGHRGPPLPDILQRAYTAASMVLGEPEGESPRLEISSDVPVAVGLGSSAALCVALIRALAQRRGIQLSDREVAVKANEVEKIFHGTPSGIDTATAAGGGLLWFERKPKPHWEQVTAAHPLPLVIALSGETHRTRSAVGGLAERVSENPSLYRPLFEEIASLVKGARHAIETGDLLSLGALMSRNHELLRSCGVSTAPLDRLVGDAHEAGAHGAKLTGAGGGGAVIALAAGEPQRLGQELEAKGWKTVGGAAGLRPVSTGLRS